MADANPVTLLGPDGREYPAHRLSARIVMAVAEWIDRQRLRKYELQAREEGHALEERVAQRTALMEAETTMLGALRAILFDPRAQAEMLRVAIVLAAKNEKPADGEAGGERERRASLKLEDVLEIFGDDIVSVATRYLDASGYRLFGGSDEKDGKKEPAEGGDFADPFGALMRTLISRSTSAESQE